MNDYIYFILGVCFNFFKEILIPIIVLFVLFTSDAFSCGGYDQTTVINFDIKGAP